MKPPGGALSAAESRIFLPKTSKFLISDGGFNVAGVFSLAATPRPPRQRRFCLRISCTSGNSDARMDSSQYPSQFGDLAPEPRSGVESLNFEVSSPSSPLSLIPSPKLSLNDQAFLLLAFIGCTTSVAFSCLVAAAVPTLFAMRRAAISLSKLADTAREELPSTMAAIRLSGMEISDLTLELSDLSQEIADGVNKSAQAVQAAEAGVRQIGSLARQQTMVVAGAAKKTSRAVGQAAKTLMNIISPGEDNTTDEYGGPTDRT